MCFMPFVAAIPALLIFGYIAAKQQHKHQPIIKDLSAEPKAIDGKGYWFCVMI